jgi:hypothetical protein
MTNSVQQLLGLDTRYRYTLIVSNHKVRIPRGHKRTGGAVLSILGLRVGQS